MTSIMSMQFNTSSVFKGQSLTGKRFYRYVVIGFVGVDKWRSSQWLCRCDCGNEKIVRGKDLKRGVVKSCGCFKTEVIFQVAFIHGHKGLTESPLHRSWRGMTERCTNRNNKAYKYYGGRGIKVCRRWKKFENFLLDMGASWAKGLTLERRNPNGNYTPRNCKWATWKEQQNNRRSSRMIQFNRQTRTLTQWSEILAINRSTLSDRINKQNLTPKEALKKSIIL